MHTAPHRASWLLAVVLLAWPVPGGAHAEEPLRWGWSAGDAWLYRLESSSQVDMLVSVPGPRSKTVTEDMDLRVAVLQVGDDGTALLELRWQRMSMTEESSASSARWVSDDPDATDAAGRERFGFFEAALDAPVSLRLSARGELSDVQGVDELVQGVLQAAGRPQDADLRDQLTSMFGEERLRTMFLAGLGVFPEEPAAAGLTWQAEVDVTLPLLSAKLRTRYENTVQKPGRKAPAQEVRIRQRGAMVLVPGEQSDVNQVVFRTRLESGGLEGMVVFDTARGLIQESHQQLQLVLRVQVEGDKRMRLDQSITTRYSYSLLGPAEPSAPAPPETGKHGPETGR